MVQLLQRMQKPLLDAALQASPQRTGDVVYSLLAAAAASWCSPQEWHKHSAEVIAFFATRTTRTMAALCRDGSSSSEQVMQRVASIEGLPAMLADYVARLVSPGQEERESKVGLVAGHLSLLELVLQRAPAGEQHCLTPQQLERMQLLPLLRQQPLHGATPWKSLQLIDLHVKGMSVVLKIAARHGGDQLPLRYWAATGVHQLQVSAGPGFVQVLCCLLACAPSSC